MPASLKDASGEYEPTRCTPVAGGGPRINHAGSGSQPFFCRAAMGLSVGIELVAGPGAPDRCFFAIGHACGRTDQHHRPWPPTPTPT